MYDEDDLLPDARRDQSFATAYSAVGHDSAMQNFGSKTPKPPVTAAVEYTPGRGFTLGIQTQLRQATTSDEFDVILQFDGHAVRGRGPLTVTDPQHVTPISHTITAPFNTGTWISDVADRTQSMAYKVNIRYIKVADGFAGQLTGTESWLYRLCSAVFSARKSDPLHTYTRPVVQHIGAWYTVQNLVAVHEWLVRIVEHTAAGYNCRVAWETADTMQSAEIPVRKRGTPMLIFRGTKLVRETRGDMFELFLRLCTHTALQTRAPDVVTERMRLGRQEDRVRLAVKLAALS